MGYTTSTVHGIEVPDSSEPNNIPEDIGKVVTALEAGSLAKRLTGAAISALTVPQKPAGLLVYNTTTNKLQISDGTNFADVDATPTWQTWTPTITQSVTVAWSASHAKYFQLGKMVQAICSLAVTGTGAAGHAITLTLPVAAAAAGAGGGSFRHFDIGNQNYGGWAGLTSATALSFYVSGSNVAHGINAGTLSNGDFIDVAITYEAA